MKEDERTSLRVSRETARKVNELRDKYNFKSTDDVINFILHSAETIIEELTKEHRKRCEKEGIPYFVGVGVAKDEAMSEEEMKRILREYQ